MVSSDGQNKALLTSCSQDPTLIELINMSSTSLVTDANLQPMRVLPKPSSTPLKYFQRQLASMSKLEPGEQTPAKIQLLWNQLASPQPLG